MRLLTSDKVRALTLVLTFGSIVGFSSSALSNWGSLTAGLGFAPAIEIPVRSYLPPARKSMIVGLDGLAHTTADNMLPTFRDRSQILLSFPAQNFTPVEKEPAVLREYQIEETPIMRQSAPKRVRGRLIEEPSVNGVLLNLTRTTHRFEDRYLTTSDRAITNRIRHSILSDDALFATTRDIRIITVEGRVTLAGMVTNEQERQAIGKKAAHVVGERNVDNQLAPITS